MTTSASPLRVLKAQADAIAKHLKMAERSEAVVTDPKGTLAASRKKGVINFAVAMDDKVLKIEMEWKLIREYSEVALAAYLLKHMRGNQETVQ